MITVLFLFFFFNKSLMIKMWLAHSSLLQRNNILLYCLFLINQCIYISIYVYMRWIPWVHWVVIIYFFYLIDFCIDSARGIGIFIVLCLLLRSIHWCSCLIQLIVHHYIKMVIKFLWRDCIFSKNISDSLIFAQRNFIDIIRRFILGFFPAKDYKEILKLV